MINLYPPTIQIDFAYCLEELRQSLLMDALQDCINRVEIKKVDEELHKYVPPCYLKKLAYAGLRGEILFPIPYILEANPRLLGYYRLLLGYSQKAFYTPESGVGQFKSMEEKNRLSIIQKKLLPELCNELIRVSSIFLDGLNDKMINRNFFDDLTLLTLGPQLRGGANVKRGVASIKQVFDVIHSIVKNDVITSSPHHFEILNSSGRRVLIEFASDPDIVIREETRKDIYRYLIAIEVKGGQDYSNIHNRIGEAEKSHQKARKSGYIEFWTVVNVDKIDMGMAHRESPSTNKFYKISDLLNSNSEEFADFKTCIISTVGIK